VVDGLAREPKKAVTFRRMSLAFMDVASCDKPGVGACSL